MNKTYNAPKLVVHGDVQALTQGNSKPGPKLDKSFPPRTPKSKLTFTS